MPADMATDFPVTESPGSESGQYYVSATGDHVANLGQRRLRMLTAEGQLRSMAFQVAKVKKPLASVSKICANGFKVVFDDDGSYLEHKSTGARTAIVKKRGVYVLEAWLMPEESNQDSTRQA